MIVFLSLIVYVYSQKTVQTAARPSTTTSFPSTSLRRIREDKRRSHLVVSYQETSPEGVRSVLPISYSFTSVNWVNSRNRENSKIEDSGRLKAIVGVLCCTNELKKKGKKLR